MNEPTSFQQPMPIPGQPVPELTPKSRWNKKTKLVTLGSVLVILVLAGAAYAIMRPAGDGSSVTFDNGVFGNLPSASDQDKPKVSGLSGKACEHYDRRPLAVMLAGDPINRPMSGFSKADMVWELPVLVSNVTRLLAAYQCGEPTDIGSVRSVRHDYLFLGAGMDAIIAHWGGSYHALNRIAAGEFQTISALANPHNAFFRKSHLPAPYNGFTTYERLWNALEKLGYRTTTNFAGYDFKDDAPVAERSAGGTLSVGWPGAFAVRYEYDPTTNRYVRYWGGTKQIDAEDQQAVAPSVVVIMRATNQFANGPGGYNDVSIRGSGSGAVYQDGKEIPMKWSKSMTKFDDPVKFMDEAGNPITFTRGQVWIMTPSPDIAVTWTPTAAAASPTAAPL